MPSSDFDTGVYIERFRSRLEDQIADISRTPKNGPDALASLGEKIHKLAGGAGQLGLKHLAMTAAMADQMIDGILKAGRPPSDAEHVQLQSIIDRLPAIPIAPPAGDRSVLLYGLPGAQAEVFMETLEICGRMVEVGEDADDLADFVRRAPEGPVLAATPIDKGAQIPNPVVLAPPVGTQIPSGLHHDVVLTDSGSTDALRSAMAKLLVLPSIKLELSGLDEGLSQAVATLVDHHGASQIMTAGDADISLSLQPGETLSLGGSVLTIPVPIDPLLFLRWVKRAARHLD